MNDETNNKTPEKNNKKRRLLMLSVPAVIAIGGLVFWAFSGRYVKTDNAYISQPMISLSTEVAGRVVEVDVVENQKVEQGEMIFQIDPTPYEIALAQADAQLQSAKLAVEGQRAAYHTAKTQFEAAQSILETQNQELARQQSLSKQGVTSSTTLDQATLAAKGAQNSAAIAKEQLTAAAVAFGGDPELAAEDMPAVRMAQAGRDKAARDLANTKIIAPGSGVISQIDNLNNGQFLAAGVTAARLVNTNETWIDANFKESQLEKIKIGMPVHIKVDAYSDLELEGEVQSISSATGSQFSLIPAQNATGNWVKVVQRITVRISLTPNPDYPLRDGMSAEVKVDSGKNRLQSLL